MSVVYESPVAKIRRYQVQWLSSYGRWATEGGPGYRSLTVAKLNVKLWNSIGHKARVIDRSIEESN